MGLKTTSVMPWFVLAACVILFGAILASYTDRPVARFDIFLLCQLFFSMVGLVVCYFRIYAIFDRIDARAKEYERNTRT